MEKSKSNEILAQDISYIKADIIEIKKKLDEKYVSHETFDLTVQSLNKAISTVVKVGMFIVSPIYVAVIALLFKIFAN
jgi:hypothetical protein